MSTSVPKIWDHAWRRWLNRLLKFCGNNAWRFVTLWKCHLKVCHIVEMPPKDLSFCGNAAWRVCHFIEKSLAGFVIAWKCRLEVLSLYWKVTCGWCHFVEMTPGGFVTSLKSHLRVLLFCENDASRFCRFIEKSLEGFVNAWKCRLGVLPLAEMSPWGFVSQLFKVAWIERV